MRKNILIYVIALSVAAVVKICGSVTDSDLLTWILTPVSWWVTILGGISFQYTQHIGYVSHAHRFIIASSCAGVRFLVLTFLMLVFSFTHQINTTRRKAFWLAFSAVFSYAAAVFVNAVRITAAIYVPEFLEKYALMPQWLNAKNLHTIIGTAVYFSFLFVIYILAGKIFVRLFGTTHEIKSKDPIFWYVVTVLVLPFFSRLYYGEWTGFGRYALPVAGVCVVVMAFGTLITRRIKRLTQ